MKQSQPVIYVCVYLLMKYIEFSVLMSTENYSLPVFSNRTAMWWPLGSSKFIVVPNTVRREYYILFY